MSPREGDVIRTLRDNIAHIGHFHTAGNPGRKDLDDLQELYYPAWLKDLKEKLPADYVVVGPGDLARLFAQNQGISTFGLPPMKVIEVCRPCRALPCRGGP